MKDIFNDYSGFLKFGQEVVLNILKKSDIKLSEIEEEILEKKKEKGEEYFILKEDKKRLKEVMVPYIELYKRLSKSGKEEEENFEDIEKAKAIIINLMEINKLEKNKIIEDIEKREKYLGESGSEVVKNFLEYQLKELNKLKLKLSEKAVSLLREESELKDSLSEAIQEEESAVLVDKLFQKEKEVEIISDKICICEERIKEIEEDIETEWKFQIYGTISKEELRKRV